MKKILEFWEKKMKVIKPCDMFFIKSAAFVTGLLVAKLWMPILSLEWYWYAVIIVAFSIKPVYTVFFKK